MNNEREAQTITSDDVGTISSLGLKIDGQINLTAADAAMLIDKIDNPTGPNEALQRAHARFNERNAAPDLSTDASALAAADSAREGGYTHQDNVDKFLADFKPSANTYAVADETEHLLSSDTNARRLRESVAQLKSGGATARELIRTTATAWPFPVKTMKPVEPAAEAVSEAVSEAPATPAPVAQAELPKTRPTPWPFA